MLLERPRERKNSELERSFGNLGSVNKQILSIVGNDLEKKLQNQQSLLQEQHCCLQLVRTDFFQVIGRQ